MDLYDHQQDAVDQMFNGCILRGGVGTGKSRVAIAYYLKNEAPKDVYVVTTAKKRDELDWLGEAAHIGLGTTREGSVLGVLTVDSWNNIGKYTEVEDAFFVFDEQRLVGSGAWVHAFLKIVKQNRWILLSATPGDNWLDFIPVFIANGFYKNRTEFKREHVIYSHYGRYPRVERYVGQKKLARLRDELIVEMPYERHTTRHVGEVLCDYDRDLMKMVVKKRWHVYENRPLRDAGEMWFVMRKIVYSDPARLNALMELVQEYSKVIVFYNFDYELEILKTLGGTIAEWNGHRHDPIPDSDEWLYLVQYTAGSEGWNCIETNVMVFYSLTYSYKLYHQAQGRIDRLNTPFSDLFYYNLISDSTNDKAVLRALKAKKSFNEPKKW